MHSFNQRIYDIILFGFTILCNINLKKFYAIN